MALDQNRQTTNQHSSSPARESSDTNPNLPPAIALPKGGGAIRGIGEKFAANPVTGTGSMTVPIATSPGRSGFGPQLSLSYDSGAGNGPFGFGWSLSLPAITRKTEKGLPRYFDGGRDQPDSDVFILSGAEDLVPVLTKDTLGNWILQDVSSPGGKYVIRRYQPRIEGLFARIERWLNTTTGELHWRSISRDNITTLYGKTEESRVADPEDSKRVFTWLICESYDDKGNAIVYQYAAENDESIDHTQVNEPTNRIRTTNRYVKRIKYGNRTPNRDATTWKATDPAQLPNDTWMFEVVFDYDEGYYEMLDLDPARSEADQHRLVRASALPELPWPSVERHWPARLDPFSSYRASFEVRTYRRCHRVLLFHRFAELGSEPYLTRSTEFDYGDLDYSQPTTIEDELTYQGSTRFASFMRTVTQSGFVRDDTQAVLERNSVKYFTYLKKSLPPLEFEYSKAHIQDDIRELDAESLENLPVGLDGASYQWMDLDGEGTYGILTEQADGWFYKRNLSANNLVPEDGHERTVARFGPMEVVASKPAVGLAGGGQFLDLASDGQVDLVVMEGPLRGFYERTEDASWAPFQPFVSWPNLSTRDPDLRFVDLTGDGHADILITEGEALTWYPSLAEEGFGSAVRVSLPSDEEQGPRLVFADGTQSIYLADVSGDGLSLVRIRNGEVCYWPNLGYGHFGAKVTMDNAPWFDSPDQFDQRRIRLADTDGSVTTDILYLRRDGVHIYFNQSGNSWSDGVVLPQFPPVDTISSVQALDLLGNGTACLVWSSPLPGASRRPMRYLALMKEKPHLLVGVKNNLGAETKVHYAPSTRFYLDDKRDGKPWVTRLPFPVHVVERVETYDRISRNHFVTRYTYHHGYFDGVEREFRGFGMVEQRDTEEFAALTDSGTLPEATNLDAASHVPPVLTRTWFHTGVYLDREHISRQFEDEYYPEHDLSDPQFRALLLPDTVLPIGLVPEEEREACRALKGSMLRQEIYALDGTGSPEYPYGHPYTVAEQNFTIERLQPKGDNRHAVFFTHAREAISYHYERNPADPRISHALTLEVDPYGNILKSLAVGYGRKKGQSPLQGKDKEKQEQVLITYTENDVTKAIDAQLNDPDYDPDNYRTPLPSETRSYEVTGLELAADVARFSFDDFAQNGFQPLLTLSEIQYEEPTDYSKKQKRLIEHTRTLYRPDDLGVSQNDPLTLLPLGKVQPLALPGESYKLAFTHGLARQIFVDSGKLSQVDLDSVLANEGRYVHSEGDNNWWIPSGRMFYSPDSGNDASTERAYARQHFFLPHRYRNPFHTNAVSTESFVTYDSYDLLMLETRDALGNRITVGERNVDPTQPLVRHGHNYRVLQPALMMDPNRNRSAVAFDALGMVAGTAVMGKPEDNPVPGDSLAATFHTDLTQAEIDQFFANPKGPMAATLLDSATTRIIYDLTGYWREPDPQKKPPAFDVTLARETHTSDHVPAGDLKIQLSFSYSDGFGREIQKKIQAEPGRVPKRDANGKIIVGADGQPEMTANDVSPRWVGSGWIVFNNKGKPVRQYEPFFTDTHRFEFDVKIGVSPVLFYDPVERVVATLHPNHTYEKVIFDPWRQETWDVNDTVLVADPKTDADVGDFFRRLPDGEYLPTWHALRTDPAYAAAFTTRYPDPTVRAKEAEAAQKTQVHAGTYTVVHFDTLGRTFLTVAHNKFKYSDTPPADPPIEEFYRTRVDFDIEGNQREVRDERKNIQGNFEQRIVMSYDYDMLSNRIHQASMEAGERWMLNDVMGKPLYAWDSRGHILRTEYDPLRRPLRIYVIGADSANPNQELLTERMVYGEQHPEEVLRNLRGRLYLHLDQAGVVLNELYDFKGNLQRASRRLTNGTQYRQAVDWSGVDTNHVALPPDATTKLDLGALEAALAPRLEAEAYTSLTTYDALNRPVTLTTPHTPAMKANVIRPGYNEANLLEQVEANLQGTSDANDQPVWTPFITNIDYNAKGQRTLIDYGNGARTTYEYDPLTFRLIQLLTQRDAITFPDDCPQTPPVGWPGCQVQNLHYTYDPVGNITHIRDDAQQTIYFRNKRVEPSAEYTYDAIYRLIEATGREHLGQVGGTPIPHSYNDAPRVGIDWSTNDGNAMGTYLERYVYDAVGNFLEMQHHGSDPAKPGWTRSYAYNEASLIESGKQSNRLSSTTIGATTETYSTLGDGYDAHGSMLRMPHLQVMQWDFKDQLQMTQRQAVNAADADGVQHQGERTWYVYDSAGQRVRKVTELTMGQVKDEHIYLGGFEIYRKNGANPLVRETLHVMDDKQRIALVETRTQGNDLAPQQLIRYQFGNHLGSAVLELDYQAQIISYEEYTPYGSTSYQAVRSQTETPKRFRYTGKERDEESGLDYHGARYYAPWLGIWTSCDPNYANNSMHRFGTYTYGRANPLAFIDPDGREDRKSDFNFKPLFEHLDEMVAKVRESEKQASEIAGSKVRAVDKVQKQKLANTGEGIGVGIAWLAKQALDHRKTEAGQKQYMEEQADKLRERHMYIFSCLSIYEYGAEIYGKEIGRPEEMAEALAKAADARGTGKKQFVWGGRGTVLLEELRSKYGFETIHIDSKPDIKNKDKTSDAATRKSGFVPNTANKVIGADTGERLDVRVRVERFVKLGTNISPESRKLWEALKKVEFAVGVADSGMHTFVLSRGMVYEIHWNQGPKDPGLTSVKPLDKFFQAWGSGVIAVPPFELEGK